MMDFITNRKTQEDKIRRSVRVYLFIGIVTFIFFWFLISLFFSDIIIASPWQTFIALIQLILTKSFWITLSVTLWRFLAGFISGSVIGIVLGVIAGLKKNIRLILEPSRWAFISMPPVVLVMISMIIFGMGSLQTIFVTTVLIIPIMYVNTIEGIDSIDIKLLEMGKVYQANTLMMLRQIYLPGIGGHVLAGLTLATGIGVRIVVLAEVLGSHTGIGYQFYLARVNLETAKLYAWIIICLIIVGFSEFGILKPLRKYVLKWKQSDKNWRII